MTGPDGIKEAISALNCERIEMISQTRWERLHLRELSAQARSECWCAKCKISPADQRRGRGFYLLRWRLRVRHLHCGP